jgi:hypothetical protein
MPALVEGSKEVWIHFLLCNNKEREMVAQEPAQDNEAELAAEITSHTHKERPTASRPVTTSLVDPHVKGGGSQSTAARSRIDARRYRGVRPDELRAVRRFASRGHIKTKEK